MASLEVLEDTKYFPPGFKLGAQHRRDTVVTTYVDGTAYFRAIADVLDTLGGPDDRLYITSWNLDLTTRLRPLPGEVDFGERLVKLDSNRVDVRVIVAVPRYALGASWARATWNPASWDPEPWRVVAAYGPTRQVVQMNIAAVQKLRSAGPPLSRRVLIDWGGASDSRHEKCTIAYSATTHVLHAFVGGLDYVTNRISTERHQGTPQTNYWHDLGVHLQGGAAEDVLSNFWTRWDETATLPPRRYWFGGIQEYNPAVDPKPSQLKPSPLQLPGQRPPGSHVDSGVRIWRSYAPLRVAGSLGDDLNLPWQTLPSQGVPEVAAGLISAIDAAQRYIYVEDQTLNPSTAAVIYNHHRVLFPVISAACGRGVKVIFVTQGFSPESVAGLPIMTLSDATPDMALEIQWWLLEDLTPQQQTNFALFYLQDTKVHSKLVMVDDEFASIGSANFWDRSQDGDESEVKRCNRPPWRGSVARGRSTGAVVAGASAHPVDSSG